VEPEPAFYDMVPSKRQASTRLILIFTIKLMNWTIGPHRIRMVLRLKRVASIDLGRLACTENTICLRNSPMVLPFGGLAFWDWKAHASICENWPKSLEIASMPSTSETGKPSTMIWGTVGLGFPVLKESEGKVGQQQPRRRSTDFSVESLGIVGALFFALNSLSRLACLTALLNRGGINAWSAQPVLPQHVDGLVLPSQNKWNSLISSKEYSTSMSLPPTGSSRRGASSRDASSLFLFSRIGKGHSALASHETFQVRVPFPRLRVCWLRKHTPSLAVDIGRSFFYSRREILRKNPLDFPAGPKVQEYFIC